jgi:alkylated DNA repair dioxygenase AlkB
VKHELVSTSIGDATLMSYGDDRRREKQERLRLR